MKRRLSLLFTVLLLLSMARTPTAHASAGDLPSRERGGEEINIDEDGVPLIEFPEARIAAQVTVDAGGAAAAAVTAEQILEAVGTVTSGGAVRITVSARAEAADAVSAVLPKEALEAVVELTGAEMEIDTGIGWIALTNEAVASIVKKAGGEDVTISMARMTAETGRELLEEVLGAGMDVAEERIRDGSVIEIGIFSGGESITCWDGGAAALGLSVGSGRFEENKGYRVIQISADKSTTEHTGRCVMSGERPCVELSITHLSTFVVLADAVEEDMAGGGVPLVASPLAGRSDDGGSAGTSAPYLWFAAGLALVLGAAAGITLQRRRRH